MTLGIAVCEYLKHLMQLRYSQNLQRADASASSAVGKRGVSFQCRLSVLRAAGARFSLLGRRKTPFRRMAMFMASPRRQTALAAAILCMVSACPVVARTLSIPPSNGQFDYQLGGAYAPEKGVAVIARDRLARPASGFYNICYVNAFQTQPDAAKWWLKRHPGLLLKKDGQHVTDSDWPDEYLLDISTSKKRDALLSIIGAWIDKCARDGFDAVEPDNLDSWTRSRSVLKKADAIAFATQLTERAHSLGLAIAQKNASELASIGISTIGFDFAVAEECQTWSDCEVFMAAYGTAVFEVEYDDNRKDMKGNSINPIDVYEAACVQRGSRISVIYRDRDLVPAGSSRHQYRAC